MKTTKYKMNFSLFWDADISIFAKSGIIADKLTKLVDEVEEEEVESSNVRTKLLEMIEDFRSVAESSEHPDLFVEDIYSFAIKEVHSLTKNHGVEIIF